MITKGSPVATDSWPAARLCGDQFAVRAVFMRGGTSRGAYLRSSDLPIDPVVRDRVILAMYGSPDTRQIDGVGGADPLTSKVAIVSPASVAGADVDYLFGQVSINEARVDYDGNCGNILAGVGPFAIDEGMLPATAPTTFVRIHQVNTRTVVRAEVPTSGGRALVQGETQIAGVPGTGAAIKLDFGSSAGTLGRGLLPTGRVQEEVCGYRASILDAGNPTVFIRAADLGLSVQDLFAAVYSPRLLATLEELRKEAGRRIGIADARGSQAVSRTVPKIYMVHPPVDYVTGAGLAIRRSDVDVLARGLSMQRPHAAYAATVAIATGAASGIPGTVVEQAQQRLSAASLRIGHPGGVLTVEAEIDLTSPRAPRLVRAVLPRTARRIMDGIIYVPMSVLDANRRHDSVVFARTARQGTRPLSRMAR